MKIGFGHLHYASRDFWELSLREWQAALRGHIENKYGRKDTAMKSNRLKQLMEQFPDDDRSTD